MLRHPRFGFTFEGNRTLTDLGNRLAEGIVLGKRAIPSVDQFVDRCDALVGGYGELPVKRQVLSSRFWPGIPIVRWAIGDGPLRIALFVGAHADEPAGLLSATESAEQLVADRELARILERHGYGLDIIALDLDGLEMNEPWFRNLSEDVDDRFDRYFEHFWRNLRGETQGEWSGKIVDRKRGVLATKTREALRCYFRDLEMKGQQVFAHLSTHGAFFWSGDYLMTKGLPGEIMQHLQIKERRRGKWYPQERGPKEVKDLRRSPSLLGGHYEYQDHARGSRGRVYFSLDHVVREQFRDVVGLLYDPPFVVPIDIDRDFTNMTWPEVHEAVRADLSDLFGLFEPLSHRARELLRRPESADLDPREHAFIEMMASFRGTSVDDFLPFEDDHPRLFSTNGCLEREASYAARFCRSANSVRFGSAAKRTAAILRDQSTGKAVTDAMQTWTNNARASATLLPIEPWEIAASQIALLCKGGELALMRKTIGTERMLGLARSFGAV